MSNASPPPHKPIVEIRAVNYVWLEADGSVRAHRIEVRREDETEWTEIPVIEVVGKPAA